MLPESRRPLQRDHARRRNPAGDGPGSVGPGVNVLSLISQPGE